MKNKKNWRQHPPIKKPYGIGELLLDIIIGGQAGLIFTLAFVIKPEASDYFIIPATMAFLAGALHYEITNQQNRKLYQQNQKEKAARRRRQEADQREA